jgi:hypothetical protein
MSKFFKFSSLILILAVVTFSSCEDDDDTDSDPTSGGSSSTGTTPTSAFNEFDSDNVTVMFENDEITIETNGRPNHTTPYWGTGHSLYIDDGTSVTPSTIPGYDATASLTVPASPEKASSTTATTLGAIGIAVSGVAIFNDSEGNGPLSDEISTIDYAGGHIGPSEYHYHTEPAPISEDDKNLIGIMADGFLIYGRKCNSTGNYPSDLDASGGHTSSTQHGDDDFYHYHVINEIYIDDYVLLFGVDFQGTPNPIN